jgi:hypothetical protein
MTSKRDVTINVRFKTTEEGGRKTPISGEFYACPMLIDGKGFDCRIDLDGKKVELGHNYVLSVKFLNRSSVVPLLYPKKPVILWEGKDIANGEILEIFDN